MKKNLLITCAGIPGPLYQARILSKKYNIFLTDANEYSYAKYTGYPFALCPFGYDKSFKSVIAQLIKKWKIDYVVPSADQEIEPINDICNELGIISIAPNNDFVRLCLNKDELMVDLGKKGISFIKSYEDHSKVRFPAIAKPVHGSGSRNVHILNSFTELEGYFKLYGHSKKDILIQEYIKGDEYTVSVIVNNLNKLIGVVPKRAIVKKGSTHAAVSEKSRIINDICKKIVEKYNPRGTFNVQLMLHKSKAYIFEINPRLSTTSVLTDKVYENEIDNYINTYNNPNPKNDYKLKEDVYLLRYFDNFFIDGKDL